MAKPVPAQADDEPVTEQRTPARRPRDAARTRQDILAAAAQRFARSGFSHVTLKDIADDIGVTPAMVFRYFGSKRELFEEVAGNEVLALDPLVTGDYDTQLEARSRAILAYFQDHTARAPGIALIRSLDLDDGDLFRRELERRIVAPWEAELSGADGRIRARLIAGLLMGVGLFSMGALIDPDRPALSEPDAERMVHYLAKMLGACVED